MSASRMKHQDLSGRKRQAVAFCQKNDFQSAKRLLEPYRKKNALDAEGIFLLASVYGELGQYDDAVTCFQQSLTLQGAVPQTYFGLGKALQNLGRFTEAEQNLHKALQLQPKFPPAMLQLAIIHCRTNRLDEAAEGFRNVLALEPKSLNAWMGLGRIYHLQRKRELAANCFRRALEVNPRLAAAHYYLGNIYLNQAQNDEAEECYKKSIAADPSYIEAHIDLGSLYLSTNRVDEAKASFQRALAIDPTNIAATAGEASAYEQSGEIDKAYKKIEPHLESGVKHTDLGVLLSKLCRHSGRCREATAYLEDLLETEDRSAIEKEKIHFALGNLYDRLQLFDKAFQHYEQANAAKPDLFNRAEHSAAIDTLIRVFDAGFFMSTPRAHQPSERPIFIVGMPRSGTTLTEQILASHPKVFGAGEISAFPNIVRNLSAHTGKKTVFPDNLMQVTAETLTSLSTTYLDELNKFESTLPRVTDKTLANFLYLGLIAVMFPRARVIHCIRDPRDTCLSIFFQNFDESHHYATRLENIGIYYSEYSRLMDHWRSVLSIPMLDVRYEDLVNNQEAMSRKLIEFAGLDWSDQVLRFYENRRSVATASYDQVRQKMYTRSVARWKNYEKHIDRLNKALEL